MTIIDYFTLNVNYHRVVSPLSNAKMPREAVLDHLCGTCQNLFASDPSIKAEVRSDTGFVWNAERNPIELKAGEVLIAHHRVGAMLDSVRHGCHLCSFMLGEYSPKWVTLRLGDQIWIQFMHRECHSVLIMHIKETSTRTWRGWACTLYLHSDECK